MTQAHRLLAAAFVALSASHAAANLRVVATTPEYGAIAAAIGGDKIAVANLAKPTEDPHFVDAKPSHIVTLNRADVLIEGGADLESGWLPPLLDGARDRAGSRRPERAGRHHRRADRRGAGSPGRERTR